MKKHLTWLKRILKGKEKKLIFSCIEDLVSNGVDTKRFSTDELTPNRQDATQFLLKWLHHTDVSSSRCQNWIIGFATEALSEISASSASRIRHSTKSNIKYIYNSAVPFECGCEDNFFKARCAPDCPMYTRMQKIAARKKNRVQTWEVDHSKNEPSPFQSSPSIKEQYKDQFDEAIKVVAEMMARDIGFEEILNHLNEKNLKTRTGKVWKIATLQSEMRKHNLRYAKTNKGDAMYSPVKEKYHDQFKMAMKIVAQQVRRDVKLPGILAYLTEQGFKTRTGKTWQFATLRTEMKKHNIEYTSNIVNLKPLRSRVRINYKDQFEKALKIILRYKKRGVSVTDTAEYLNENRFATRTGRKWTYGNVRNELIRHQGAQFEEAIEIIKKKVASGEKLAEILKFLNSRGFENKTGKPWHISKLKAEVKRRGFKPDASVKRIKAQRASSKKQREKHFEKTRKVFIDLNERGDSAADIVAYLNENEFTTRTGKRWTVGNLRNELQRYRKEAGKR